MELFKGIQLVLSIISAIVIFSGAANGESNAEHKVVETKNGKIRGIRKTSVIKGIDYYSFKGIPYAKSPTEDLRLKAPEPVENWTPKVLDAFQHGLICIQPVTAGFGNNQDQSEDCLFLNVYVPADIKPNEKLAVLIFLHGGEYQFGSGNTNWHGPDFLMEQGVIVVTINYRLGFLGFASLNTPEYSGNMGMKDQQMAMKWVYSNIEHFSGDNQRITISGESAGGTSTNLHILSSESRKYFRNAIPMSGVVDNLWSMANVSDHLWMAYKIADDLGEPKQSLDELIEFLKSVPADDFAEYESTVGFELRTFQIELGPIVERKDAIRPFIVDLPENIYEKSTAIDVNAMFTVCSIEFIVFFFISVDEIADMEGLNRDFNLVLPFRGNKLAFDSPEYRQIARDIREFYFEDATIDIKVLKQYLDLLSDLNFGYGIHKSAKRHAAKTTNTSNTFYLQFSVDSKANFLKGLLVAEGGLDGATHLDDVCYVFYCEQAEAMYDEVLQNRDDEQSKISLQAIENMSSIFANFAKYGNPMVDGLLPIQNGQMNFLDVTNDGPKIGVDPNKKANELWDQVERRFKEVQNKRKSI